MKTLFGAVREAWGSCSLALRKRRAGGSSCWELTSSPNLSRGYRAARRVLCVQLPSQLFRLLNKLPSQENTLQRARPPPSCSDSQRPKNQPFVYDNKPLFFNWTHGLTEYKLHFLAILADKQGLCIYILANGI